MSADVKLEGRWINTLQQHGDAYGWYKSDLEALRQAAISRLQRVNPEKMLAVAGAQAEVKVYDDLLAIVTNQERKDAEYARRESQRNGPIRNIKSA